MSRTKKSVIPHYELLYIVSNEYTEDELKPIMEKVGKFITDNEGEITFKEEWGKKKLAYKIGKFSFGYYNLVEFNLVGSNLAALDKLMRMSTDIMRFMIVARPMRTVPEIDEQKRVEKEYRDTHKNAANAKKEEKLKREEKKSAKRGGPKSPRIKKEVIKKEEIAKEETVTKEEVASETKEDKKEKEAPIKKADEKEVKPKAKKKVDLDALDEKLDKILETNDLL